MVGVEYVFFIASYVFGVAALKIIQKFIQKIIRTAGMA